MYFMIDPAGTVLSVNRYGAEQLGYGIEELVGHTFLDVFHEADLDAARRHVAACLEHFAGRYGERAATQVTTNYVVFEGAEYVVGTIRDISEHMPARAPEEYYDAAQPTLRSRVEWSIFRVDCTVR